MNITELYKCYRRCNGISTDSRHISKDSMFFALKGGSFDGNDFALDALSAGAKYAVVDRPSLAGVKKGGGECLLVEDVLSALQNMAALHRKSFDLKVIGITGTNGKTTTKELISSVLASKYSIIYTSGNFNNHIGVPLTLLKINEKTEIAVVEMGASAPGEIAALVRLVQPDCGLITNVGKAHILGFGSFEGVKKTKGELYDFLRQSGGTVFYNADNPHLTEMVKARTGLVTRPYGASLQGAEILPASAEEPFLNLKLGNGATIRTKLVGSYNADNVMAALCVGAYFSVPQENAIKAIEGYRPSNDRSQMKKTERNLLIVDTYNANPTSMEAALKNFRNTSFGNKTVILGDMRELGGESAVEHDRILALACETAEMVFLVGSEFKAAFERRFRSGSNSAFDSIRCFADHNEIKAYLQESPLQDRTILIKGSHSIRLETLPELL